MYCYSYLVMPSYSKVESIIRHASKVPAFVVSSTLPANGATNVPVNQTIEINFSLGMDALTLNSINITVTPGPVTTTISLHTNGTRVIVDPNSNLANNTTFTVTTTTNVRGLYGDAKVPFTPQHTFTFTTAP